MCFLLCSCPEPPCREVIYCAPPSLCRCISTNGDLWVRSVYFIDCSIYTIDLLLKLLSSKWCQAHKGIKFLRFLCKGLRFFMFCNAKMQRVIHYPRKTRYDEAHNLCHLTSRHSFT